MSEPSNSVVVSGRIRLARNYYDLPFSSREHPENAKVCVERACDALHTGTQDVYSLFQLKDMPKTARMALMEQHLISRDLLQNSDVGAALIRADHKVSVMVNEEDHLRIQGLIAGLNLDEAASEAFQAEGILENACGFSFDPQLGYLTACPTNTGTGMRASLMLHLPVLTLFKQMGNVTQSVAKLGLTMRGIYGEGSEALGNLYQVSNQVTLGRSEADIIEAVTAVGKQLIDMETTLRERALTQRATETKDVIMRSYGILRYAVSMDSKEFMQHWSNLRLGAALEVLPVPLDVADDLLTIAQDAHARQYAKQHKLDVPAEVARCLLIQEKLNG